MKTEKPKKPSPPQLQTPTSNRIKTEWEHAVTDLKGANVRINGRLLWPGNLLNAFVLEFLDLSPAERVKRAEKLLAKHGDQIDFQEDPDTGESVGGGKLKGMGATEKPKTHKADSSDASVGVVCPGSMNGPRFVM